MLQIETDQQGSQSQPSHSPDPDRSSYSIMQETSNEKNTTFAQAGGKHIRNDTTRRSEWRRSRKIREMVEESTGLDYQSAGLKVGGLTWIKEQGRSVSFSRFEIETRPGGGRVKRSYPCVPQLRSDPPPRE
jgi:hypothetical protein